MSLKILHEDKNAKILIVTALYTGHAVSGETKTTIRRNKTPYIWISYMSDGKHATNVQKAISAYRKKVGGIIPPYIFVLDRDIICGRHMLDKMINVLGKADKNIGFCYCPFEYSGHINIKFPPMEYDINTLVHGNYISSNSLYKTSMVERVGGFVVEEKYHRMSDWAFFIKSFTYGYIGKLCPDASFIAMSTAQDISAGSNEEYINTKKLIQSDFISKIIINRNEG